MWAFARPAKARTVDSPLMLGSRAAVASGGVGCAKEELVVRNK